MTMTLRRSDNLLTRLRETPVLSDSDNARPVEQIPESNTVPNISDTPTREEVIAIWKSLNMDVKKIKYGFAPKNEQLTRADDKKDSVTQSLIKDKTFACHSRDVRKKKSIDNRHVKFKPSKSKRCPSFPLNHRRNVKGRKNPVLRRRLLLQRLRQRSERYVYNYQSAQRLRSYDLLSTRGFSGNRFNLRNECNENPERDRSNIVICEPALEAEQFCGRCASYYPEGGWGWTIVVVGVIVQVLSHGLQLGGGTGPIACAAAIKYHVSPLYTHGCLAALSAGVSLALSPITVALGVCKSTRVTAVYGGLVVALGCLYTSFATQFHQLFFSYGTVVGVGVGLTRDCSTLMVAQYFKRRRELVEIFIVSGSGLGIAVMSTFIKGLGDTVELLQAYLCLAWAAGCVAFGLLVRQNSAECQIARQYLTQAAVFVCGLATMALTAVEGSYKAYVLFAWVYGIFCGGYHYTLKIYTFERVRFRNFVRTWGFVQCAQAVPIAIGVPLSGYINVYCGSKAGYYFSSTCSLIGSLTLFCIDLHRRNKHTIEIGAPANCESTCEPSRYNRSPEEELHAAADAATALDNMFKHDMV